MTKKRRLYDDFVSIQKQKQVLELRSALLAQLPTADWSLVHKELTAINYKMFEQLRTVSPAGLKPILIRRNSVEWIAAYLVQEIGIGGWRILLKHQNQKWELSRSRKSAPIVYVRKDQVAQHDLLIEKQIGYLSALEIFFSPKSKKELANV
jgi:hypothetical protein